MFNWGVLGEFERSGCVENFHFWATLQFRCKVSDHENTHFVPVAPPKYSVFPSRNLKNDGKCRQARPMLYITGTRRRRCTRRGRSKTQKLSDTDGPGGASEPSVSDRNDSSDRTSRATQCAPSHPGAGGPTPKAPFWRHFRGGGGLLANPWGKCRRNTPSLKLRR